MCEIYKEFLIVVFFFLCYYLAKLEFMSSLKPSLKIFCNFKLLV